MEHLSDYAGFDGFTKNIRQNLAKSYIENVLLNLELNMQYPTPIII